jgi:hypothetical protein
MVVLLEWHSNPIGFMKEKGDSFWGLRPQAPALVANQIGLLDGTDFR